VKVVLTEEQQRWCTQENLGAGFDDDDPNLEQFYHVCETTPDDRVRAICDSPRLWCGQGRGHVWPALEEADPSDLRQQRSDLWARITCEACVARLRSRGCPGLEEVFA